MLGSTHLHIWCGDNDLYYTMQVLNFEDNEFKFQAKGDSFFPFVKNSFDVITVCVVVFMNIL